MQIQARVSQRLENGLLLAPRMLQSIEVLQLATQDLVNLIHTELETNETLEAVRAEPDPPSPVDEPGGGFDDAEWSPRRKSGDEGRDSKHEFLANQPADSEQLLDHVREQLAWWEVPDSLVDAVVVLAEQLDDRGFLACSDEELETLVGRDLVRDATNVLRSLEPRGLGARDCIDALLLQLGPNDPDYQDIHELLTSHLDALARNKIPQVARSLGRSVSEVQELLGRIRGLDMAPGSRFNGERAVGVVPDLVVVIREGELEITVNDSDLPSLGIVEDYASMVQNTLVEPDVKQYLRPKLESARDLIQAVEQRKKTLARVGAAVLHYQRDFLERGRSAMRPLRMVQIAEMLDLHTSTVSRAVAGKYVQTEKGVLPLRAFFDGGRLRGEATDAAAPGRLGIQEHLRAVIESEDSARPFSDDEIVAQLASRGIAVARRTVTKYRKEMGIPSSWRRRQYTTGPSDKDRGTR